ncbi:MAG: hypothetical protein JO048_15125 [Methylobacteriaceae bacterium]|nr:hypothetical protein [Methylobacteriaceae bacterium]
MPDRPGFGPLLPEPVVGTGLAGARDIVSTSRRAPRALPGVLPPHVSACPVRA